MNEKTVNMCAIDRRSWWNRFMGRLFPHALMPIPDDTVGFADSYLRTEVFARLDWKDRLRTLVSGNLRVVTFTKTDVPVRRSQSTSVVYVVQP